MFLKTRLNAALSIALLSLVACSDSDHDHSHVKPVNQTGTDKVLVDSVKPAQNQLSFSETEEGKAVLRAKAEAEQAAKLAIEATGSVSGDSASKPQLEFSKKQTPTNSSGEKTEANKKYISTTGGDYPRLVLTHQDVDLIKGASNQSPTFANALGLLKAEIDLAIETPIDVPFPKDAGGGYTHEQHKRNYKAIYGAGVLYQITGEDKYFNHAKALFMEYVELYPTLGEHPEKKEQSPGRLFWQSLNETVWLVYSIQGYDAIVDALTVEERTLIEEKLLRPVATFLSEESPQVFNKIHNHGTWAVAGVGMTGFVLNDQELVDKALFGLDQMGDAGFLKQLDKLFSPDGYYMEGPYYQRYALMPFVLFAKAIHNNEPQHKIFEYRDGILLKAIYATAHLSYNDFFFPINDALKDKGLDTIELVHGVSIAYGITKDPALMNIAQRQHTISITGDGFKLAKGIDEGLVKPFPFKSMQLRDGQAGNEGALAIFRSGFEDGHQALVMKNTSHGVVKDESDKRSNSNPSVHGHFDKLSWLYYDNEREIVTDYGAVRFLNVESKYGGHYLPENDLWAKQTIAHNTLVVDGKSHFNGDWRESQKVAPTIHFTSTTDLIDVTQASVDQAYDGVEMTRTMALLKHESLSNPLVIDIMRAQSDKAHRYDLPIHYKGHITNLSFDTDSASSAMSALGDENGYQYLWKRATGKAGDALPQITWINDAYFYTVSYAKNENQNFIFTQLGANDPDFNLRTESAVIQRASSAKNHSFFTALEKHGEYNPALEYTLDSYSSIKHLRLIEHEDIDVALIDLKSGKQLGLAIAYNTDANKKHSIQVADKTIEWTGFYTVFEGK